MHRVLCIVAAAGAVLCGCGLDRSGLDPSRSRADGGGGDGGARRDAATDGAVPFDGGPGDAAGCGPGAECAPGAVDRMGSCGRCGVAVRMCGADCRFGSPMCTEEGVCTPGEMDTTTLPCGRCSSGTQAQIRMCNESCGWDAFGAPSACEGERGCIPGEVETESEPCGMCGVRTRSRTCDGSCAYPAFGGWSSCSEGGECTPGARETSTMGCGSCGGTTPIARDCTGLCTWTPWTPTGGCTDVHCTTVIGRVVCPGGTGGIASDCRLGELRFCTCSSLGMWTSCSACMSL